MNLFISGLFVGSVFFLPWWVSFLLAVLLIVLYDIAALPFFMFFLVDMFFGPDVLWGYDVYFPLTTVLILIFFGSYFVKKRMWFGWDIIRGQ